ncbi:MAG: sigma-70 family RNA polymerase sigma factor [Oscillibacter sp.]|nr:sigma-70 family RNA polymerase sigma factor [Oscillibacter sp.]
MSTTDFAAVQERDLLSRARGGDRDAFGELVRRYEKKVLALTSRMCRNSEDGEEAAQEAFLAAWQNLPGFRGDAAFSTWLYRLASNASTDLLRREGRRSARNGPSLDDEEGWLELPDSGPSPQALAERSELKGQIESALQKLSPDHRRVLILREIHQLSYEEIGTALELDPGTVKSRISRARGRLRKILLQSGNFSLYAPSKAAESRG